MEKNMDIEVEIITEDQVEVIPALGNESNTAIRSTRFTDESFRDKKQMVYEKSNEFALSYYGISRNEQALLLAGLVSSYNVNKAQPYTEEEIAAGIQCYVPIQHVARMMGYDVDNKENKSFYRAVKNAAIRLTESGKSILMENDDKTGFSVFNIISQVDYNNNNDGRVRFKFSPGASSLFLNNKKNFTLYSLILQNKVDRLGKSGTVKLHEVLRTDFYKAERSEKGFYQVYYDFIDFKCKLFLINVHNETVKKILNNPRYSLDQISNSDNLAYERALEIEALDAITRENIKKIQESEEYKSILSYKKSKEYRNAKNAIKKLKPGTLEYEKLYKEKIKPVSDIEQKLQNQTNSIICQYPEWPDFRKRILMPAQKAFLEAYRDTDIMDMMFEYKPYSYRGKVIGIHFTIYTIEAYKRKEMEQGVQMSIFDYQNERRDDIATAATNIYDEIGGAEKESKKPKSKKKSERIDVTLNKLEKYVHSLTSSIKIELSAAEMYSLAKLADFEVIKEKYDMMLSQGNVNNPVAWLSSAIKENWQPNTYEPSKKSSKLYGPTSQFNAMMQTDYGNMEKLEKEILAN